MKARVIIAPAVQSLIEELPQAEQDEIIRKLEYLERFPRMYEVCLRGRFRRHRRFLAGNWAVYYRVVGNTVYVRGLWPARIP